MRTFFTICLLAVTLVLNAQGTATNRLIIKFHTDPCPGIKPGEIAATGNAQCDQSVAANKGTHILKHRMGKQAGQFFFTVEFSSPAQMKTVLASCNTNPMVEYAEADANGNAGGVQMVVPNDANYGSQWGLKNNGTFSPGPAVAGADIDMENAWSFTTGSVSTIVGTIDSGLKLDHPEVSNRLWVNAGEIPGNGIDDDGNGYVDDVNGWDFAYVDNDPTDDQGHGTNVTGIIAATGNNSIGLAGVNWSCRLMTLKGLDANGTGWYTWWADALYYATDNGVDVINMSLGGTSTSTTLQNAINYALNNGVTVCACMMNANNNVTYYPAGFPGVIAVGATNPDDTRAAPFFWSTSSGSNYGSHISVVAPGNYIYGLSHTSNTNYGTYWGGTSQATPLVAGVASLLLAINPSMLPAQVKAIIEQSAEDQVGLASEDVAGWDQYFGHGRLNAYAALLTTNIANNTLHNPLLSLYPSPANEVVNFNCGTTPMLAFSVTDMQGKTVLHEGLNGATAYALHCEMLRPGVYFLRIETAEETRTQRFVISH